MCLQCFILIMRRKVSIRKKTNTGIEILSESSCTCITELIKRVEKKYEA